jgi:hypothetical protein
MGKVNVVGTEWVDETKSILCRVEGDLDNINDREIITIEPEAFGLNSKNLTYEQEKKLKKLSKMLVGKNINIDAM